MHKHKNTLLAITLSLLLANVLFSFSPRLAYAQTKQYSGVQEQITQFLCTPTDAKTNPEAVKGDLYNCINKIYRFALVLAAVFGVFMVVIAGYVYMAAEGNQESVEKAKSMLVSSVASIVILSSGYILLKFLNPDLIKFQPIQPPSVVGSGGYNFSGLFTGGGGGGSSACVAREQGACTATTISACPKMAQNMEVALRACNQESHGNAAISSGVDKCKETTTGKTVSFSWGIWQINITNSYGAEFPECAGVLTAGSGPWNKLCIDGTSCDRMCTFGPKGEAGFNACTQAVSNGVRNTRQACNLFNQRGWSPWPHTRNVCGLP
jgi:hypothetical protein